jgi:predicted alpha/beta-hydrolase family hydrolase
MPEQPIINLAPLTREVMIPSDAVSLAGELHLPATAQGLVLFAHGSGSSRHSPRNQFVARTLQTAGLGTLLFDLLTLDEETIDAQTRHLRFDIKFLTQRLLDATRWISQQPAAAHLRLGYFGASTGGAAALCAAAQIGETIGAVVSRGGRPDMAGSALPRVTTATLLIVGSLDEVVLHLNESAYAQLRCVKALHVVNGATHLFEEPGKLEEVAQLATQWFQQHLPNS